MLSRSRAAVNDSDKEVEEMVVEEEEGVVADVTAATVTAAGGGGVTLSDTGTAGEGYKSGCG